MKNKTLLASAAATLVVLISVVSINGVAQRNLPLEPRPVAPRGALMDSERAMVALFENAAPSVAYITTETDVVGWFGESVGVSQGAGSGFVWDNKGHVVTNHHVIGKCAQCVCAARNWQRADRRDLRRRST